MAKAKFYAVKSGRKTGVFTTWADCEAQVKGFNGAVYKSFGTIEDANAFLGAAPAEVKKVEPPTYTENNKALAFGTDVMRIYVDGSFKDGKYSWAFVVVNDAKVVFEQYGVGTNPDAAALNNIAGECAAAMRAMNWANAKGYRAVIVHDYQGVSSWVDGFYEAKNEFTKAYAAFMKPYWDAKKVAFIKVVGHSNNQYNDRADYLAKKALGIVQ